MTSLALLLALFAFGSPQQQTFAELESTVLAELQSTHTPGAAVAIIRGDSVVFVRGFGVANVETKAPVTTDMLFQIGSLTKVFTSAAVLSAADAGRLKLDEPIRSYIGGNLAPCLGRITLQQLLSHTAGLKDEPDEYGPHDETALSEYIHSWKDDYCLLQPDKAFSYSNSGFALAGLTLQEVMKKPYADVIGETLFTPLGMSRSTFRATTAMTYPIAIGHRLPQGSTNPTVIRPYADDARLWPAGEIYSSVDELAHFAIAFMNNGVYGGKRVLPQSVIDRMSTPRAEIPALSQQYAFGMFVDSYRGHRELHHDGTMPGFVSFMRMIPDLKVAVVVVGNRDGARLDAIGNKAFELLVPAPSTSQNATTPITPQPAAMNESEMNRYVGVYTQPNRWNIDVSIKNGKLTLSQFGADFTLSKISATRFRMERQGAPAQIIAFGLDTDGKAEFVQFALWAFARGANGRR